MTKAQQLEQDNAQMAAINSPRNPNRPGPDPNDLPDGATGDQIAAMAMKQFLQWQGNVLARLGLMALTQDIPADNPTLVAALATVAATGAPAPRIVRETVAWPGGQFSTDVYEYVSPDDENIKVRSTEYLLAANPQILINELATAGIIVRR